MGSLKLDKFKEKASKLLKSDKKVGIILIIGLVGIALIFLSEFIGGTPKKEEKDFSNQDILTNNYAYELEEKLLKVVSTIEGVGQAQVMVTLENGVEYVYAQEEKTSVDRNEDTKSDSTTKTQEKGSSEGKIVVIDGQNGTKEALVQTEKQPTVKGVVIICEGGDDIMVEQKIIDVVGTALDISANRVCVAKKASQE
ncbi:hypothetical protein [Candidatus Soleaferrea massiliensis]|uniref:hypothetical protein n=1 Tax=Candidatus Soleaferrea massiliensis TaxID=1470354 RepID=UPI00058E705E|nr:hypothetical protein [Candidatus Soleaferrea massiliensis]